MTIRAPHVSYRVVLANRGGELEGRFAIVAAQAGGWIGAQPTLEIAVGRPDLDTDHDGIPTDRDQCPDDAERYDGFEDGDGCPGRGRVVVQPIAFEILDTLVFERGTATLGERSNITLDLVAQEMDDYPDLQLVEITGHATRAEARGAALAVQRATAVRAALTARGVDPNRLAIKSGSGDHPLVSFLVVRRTGEDEPIARRPPVAPALPSSAVQSTVRIAAHVGTTRFVSPDRVTVASGPWALITLLRTAIDVEDVAIWQPDAPAPSRAVRIVNSTPYTLPAGTLLVATEASELGTGQLEQLEPGQVAFVAYAPAAGAVSRSVDYGLQSTRAVQIVGGYLLGENDERITTHYTSTASQRVFVRHAKQPTATAATLPAGTVDVGDAFWIPVPPGPGGLALDEHMPARQFVRLIDARPADVRRYLDDPALPRDIADRLRTIVATLTTLLDMKPRSPPYYETRTKLREQLRTLTYDASR